MSRAPKIVEPHPNASFSWQIFEVLSYYRFAKVEESHHHSEDSATARGRLDVSRGQLSPRHIAFRSGQRLACQRSVEETVFKHLSYHADQCFNELYTSRPSLFFDDCKTS